MADVITGLHSVTIHIRDIHKARAFYRDVLGLSEIKFEETANRAVFAIPGTSTIITMHIMNPAEGGREPGTVSGVIFSHPDPAVAIAEIKRRGGTVTLEPVTFEAAGGKFVRAVFADPDGNEFLISNRPD
jgi:predicted enzyme related to lactoylglutathione lyase